MSHGDRRQALVVGALGAGCLAAIAAAPAAWPALTWAGASFLVVAVAYACEAHGVFGKRADGRLPLARVVALGPFLALTWATWHLQRALGRERPWDEIRPGLFLGRRCLARELPAVDVIVDLTAELDRPRGTPHAGYRCVPTLDTQPPPAAAVDHVVTHWTADRRVFVHCASGHGRSASVVAAVLLATAHAGTVEDALAMVRAARPAVAPSRRQLRWLRRRWSHNERALPGPASG